MRTSRFPAVQVVDDLEKHEARTGTADRRRHGIIPRTLYIWRQTYGELEQGAAASPRPDVGEVEVVLPGPRVVADLPAAGDGRAVLTDGAGEALGEVQRRKIRLLPAQ